MPREVWGLRKNGGAVALSSLLGTWLSTHRGQNVCTLNGQGCEGSQSFKVQLQADTSLGRALAMITPLL